MMFYKSEEELIYLQNTSYFLSLGSHLGNMARLTVYWNHHWQKENLHEMN